MMNNEQQTAEAGSGVALFGEHGMPSVAMMEQVAARFRVLGDVNRIRILAQLRGGECAVGALAEALELGQASVSKHLDRLRSCGMVHCRRDGVHRYFSIRDQSVYDLCAVVCGAVQRTAAEDHAALQLP